MAKANPPQQPVAAAFALNPAAATGNDVLDFTNKLHKVHYFNTTKSLYGDKEEKFNFTEARLQEFLTSLKERTDASEISTVETPQDLANIVNGPFKNFIEHYGGFTHQHIRTYAVSFLGGQSRPAQDDYTLYQLLIASITHDSLGELACDEDEYVHRVVPRESVPWTAMTSQ